MPWSSRRRSQAPRLAIQRFERWRDVGRPEVDRRLVGARRPLRHFTRAAVGVSLALSACVRPPSPHLAQPLVGEQGQLAERTLRALSQSFDGGAYRAMLRVKVENPVTHRIESGRGVLAVLPAKAMRMVLIGPAGATILDAWVTTDQWRFELPPLDSVQRGSFDPPPAAALPVGFFRWWFLAPFAGTLTGFDSQRSRYFVDTPAAKVEFVLRRADLTEIEAVRFGHDGHVEAVTWRGIPDGSSESLATYRDYTTGVRVEAVAGARAPLAQTCLFADPDGPPCDEPSSE